jgi:hypothetical protein
MMRQGSTNMEFFKTFLENVLPGTYEQMVKNMRPCPITVIIKLNIINACNFFCNETFFLMLFKEKIYYEINQDETVVPMAAIIPSGEYKVYSRIFTAKNETFFEMNTYYVLKNNVCC